MTDDERRPAIETEIRDAHARGDLERAATVAIDHYGRELASFIAARLHHDDAAADVFSTLVEDLWRGLPGFRFGSSFRTWAYALAKHAIARHRRAPAVRRQVAVSTLSPLVDGLVNETRANTATWRRTEVKDRVRALRDRLSDDDQELLILRVDRGMSFEEILDVTSPECPPEERRRRAAALRKRFERVKERLRAWAKEDGLLGDAA